ncbi:MAG TPA: glycosyltransferase [Nocardioides sp.]|nr:glycosyltransferase [Nocardioides sp.]
MAEPAAGTVSVLMPIHAGLHPAHLARALGSVAEQTRAPDEVVLVEDGPLPDALRDVVATAAAQLPRLVRETLPVNRGAGVANQAGLRRCSGEWVLKADGDDVSLPQRLQRQLDHAAETGADVCGSAMLEFSGTEEHVVAVRTPPLTHEDIARRMRWNNPINHPTALYRADRARAAGGYGDLRYMQDYDLFARMLSQGARFANLAEPLVLFRAGDAVMARRRSPAMRRCEWQLQRNLREYGVVGPARRYANYAARQGARMLPAPAMARLHRALFSRSTGAEAEA